MRRRCPARDRTAAPSATLARTRRPRPPRRQPARVRWRPRGRTPSPRGGRTARPRPARHPPPCARPARGRAYEAVPADRPAQASNLAPVPVSCNASRPRGLRRTTTDGLGARPFTSLRRATKHPVPPDPQRVGGDAQINNERLTHDVRPRQESPEATVIGLVAVVAHHPVVPGRDRDRAPIVGRRVVAGRVAPDVVG